MELGIYNGWRVTLIPAIENLVWHLVLDGGFGYRIQREFEQQYLTPSQIVSAVREMSDQLDETKALMTSLPNQ